MAACLAVPAVLTLALPSDVLAAGARHSIAVSPSAPGDIPGGAPNAGLKDAARFVWQQFIALTWPAAEQTAKMNSRGFPALEKVYGDPDYAGPLVWETFRSKSETFPGIGEPHGHDRGFAADYGFDAAPKYIFAPDQIGSYPGLEPGMVPACDAAAQDTPTPWIDLSESHEAGPEDIFAGIIPPGEANERRFLYAVELNRNYYRTIAANGWYDGGNPGSTIPSDATEKYIHAEHRSPPWNADDYTILPPGTLEVKGAWRRLTDKEAASGRFYQGRVRYYLNQDPAASYRGVKGDAQKYCYANGRFGLVGLHIKIRTVSAPYNVWATFEQADNLLSPEGAVVEDDDGALVLQRDVTPFDPKIVSRNAQRAVPPTPESLQKLSPATADSDPGQRVFFQNPPNTPTTQGIISVNLRQHPIADPIVEINGEAHRALAAYAQQRGLPPSPWAHYKLVGVQWRPADKPVPGQDLLDDPTNPNEVLRHADIYYLANIVIETSHRLQFWSGHVQRALPPPNENIPVDNLITDFHPNGDEVKNVQFDAEKPDGKLYGYNMGGCMGCHGQMQRHGYDFSFVLRRGRVLFPEVGESRRLTMRQMVFE